MPDTPLVPQEEQQVEQAAKVTDAGSDFQQLAQGYSQRMQDWIAKNPNNPSQIDIPRWTESGAKNADQLAKDFETGLQNLGNKNFGSSPNQNAFLKITDLPKEYSAGRYNKGYYLNQDNEDLYARDQSTAGNVLRGVGNFGYSFSKTLWEGVTAPLAGAMYMVDGNKNTGFIDNPYNKWMESWSDPEPIRIYESASRRNAPWYSSNYWMTTNSLSNVLGTVGDLAAFAVLGGKVVAPTVGRLASIPGRISQGITEARAATALGEVGQLEMQLPKIGDELLGAEFNTYTKNLGKFASEIPQGEQGTQVVNELRQGLSKINVSNIGNAEKLQQSNALLSDLSKKYVNDLTSVVKPFNKFQAATIGTVTNLGMAQSSAYQYGHNLKQSLIEEIHVQGRTPTDDELQKIEEYSQELAGTVGTIMTVMGAVTLHGIATSLIAKGEGQQFVRNQINNIVRTDGSTALAPQYEAVITKGLKNKALNFGKKTIKNANIGAGVGFLEFGAAPASAQSYYDKKYHTGSADLFNDAIIPNIQAIASKEGITSFITGIIAGTAINGLTGGIGANIKEGKERKGRTADAIGAINSTYATSAFKTYVNSAKRGIALRGEKLEKVAEGDKYGELNATQGELENYIYPRIRYGQKELVDQDIDSMYKLSETEDGIKQLQADGVIQEGTNHTELRQQFREHLKDMQEYTNNAESYYKALTLKYGGVGKMVDGKFEPAFNEEHFEKLMYLSGAIDNRSKRIVELNNDIRNSELATDPQFIKNFTGLLGGFEELKGLQNRTLETPAGTIPYDGLKHLTKEGPKVLFDQIDALIINPDKKDILADKLTDFLKLNVERKHLLGEYNSVRDNPAEHRESVVDTLIPVQESTDQLDQIVVPTNQGDRKINIGAEYYAGSKIVPGKTEDGQSAIFRSFSKFRVVGEKDVNGKRYITVQTDNGQMNIPAEIFGKYRISKVSELEKPENHNGKYYFDNINSVFEYNYGRQGKKRGRIEYDKDTNEFTFLPEDGSKPTRITKDQFRTQDVRNKEGEVVSKREPRIKKVGEITKADKEWLEARVTKQELEQREKRLETKREVLSELIVDKQGQLNKTAQKIKEHGESIKQLKEQVSQLKGQLPDAVGSNYERGILDSITDTRKLIKDTNQEIANALDSKERLEQELEDLDVLLDSQGEGSPLGKAFLSELDDIRSEFTDIIDNTDKQIKTLSDYLDDGKKLMRQLLTGAKKIARKLLGKVEGNDIATLEGIVNREYPELETAGYNELIPEYSEDIRALKGLIKQYKDIDIDFDPKNALETIDSLESYRSKVQLLLYLVNDITSKFEQHLEKLRRQELRNKNANTQALAQYQANIDRSQVLPVSESEALKVAGEWEPRSKKLSKVFMSGISSGKNLSDPLTGNYEERFNNFMTNLNKGFTKPTDATDEYASDLGNMRAIVVTRNNQHHYFAGDFIAESYSSRDGKVVNNSTDGKDAAVAYVMVYEGPDGRQFIGQDGKLLGKVSEGNADPKQAVFQYMETADPAQIRPSGYQKYQVDEGTDAQKEDVKKYYTQEALTSREKIVSSTDRSQAYSFTQSVGSPNFSLENGKIIPQNNPVSEVNLIPESDIKTGVIQIPTILQNTVQTKTNRMTGAVGHGVLVYGDNAVMLTNRKFYETGKDNPKMVNHLYEVIKGFSADWLENGLNNNNVYGNYLKGVLYMKTKVEEGDREGGSQLHIDRNPATGEFSLMYKIGDKGYVTKFTLEDIEADRDQITDWLKGAYHGIDKEALDKGGSWTEVTGIKDGKPETRIWPSYTHYLISANNPDGSRRNETVPLSTNIPVEHKDNPVKGKYITPEFNGAYFKPLDLGKLSGNELKVEEVKPIESTKVPKVNLNGKEVILDGQTEAKTNPVPMGDTKITVSYISKVVGDKVEVTITGGIKESGEIVEVSGEGATQLKTALEFQLNKAYTERPKPAEVKVEPIPEPAKSVKQRTVTEVIENSNKVDNDIDAGLAKAKGKLLMEASPYDKFEITEDIDAVRTYIEKQVPQLKFEELPEFIKTGKGTVAYGQYRDQLIQVSKDAPRGTGDHEIWHGVEDSFVSGKELNDIRREFAGRTGSYTDRFGKEIEYSKGTEYDRQEKMAEEFREFRKADLSYKSSSPIQNFFRKLWNFIKHTVLGKPTTLKELFNRVNKGYYSRAKVIQRTGTENLLYEMQGINEVERKYIMEGVFERIMGTLRDSNGGLVRLADGMTDKELFGSVKDWMRDYYTNADAEYNMFNHGNAWLENGMVLDEVKTRLKDARLTWDKMDANWDSLVKDMKSYLRKYNIIFSKSPVVDAENSRAEVIEENNYASGEQENKGKEYDIESVQIDAGENANLEIKWLFSSLTRVDKNNNPNLDKSFNEGDVLEGTASTLTPAMLPELAGERYEYQVLDKMSGILEPTEVQKALYEMAKQDTTLVRLYNSVYKPLENRDDSRMRVSFYNFATKIKPEWYKNYIAEDGTSSVIDANTDNNYQTLVRNWESDLRLDDTGLVDRTATNFVINTSKIINPMKGRYMDMLRQLQLPVDQVAYKFTASDKRELENMSEVLYKQMKQYSYIPIGRKSFDSKELRAIATKLSEMGAGGTNSSFTNLDGNTVQAHKQYSSIERTMTTLNNAGSLDKLYQIDPRFKNDSWVNNSQLLKKGGILYNEVGKQHTKLRSTIISGIENIPGDRKVGIADLSEPVRFVVNLNNNLGTTSGEGLYSTTIAADKKTEPGMVLPHYLDYNTYKDQKERNSKFQEIAMGYLTDEMTLIQENTSGKRILTASARENDNYKKLQVFKDILSPELRSRIENWKGDPKELLDTVSKEVMTDVGKWVDENIDQELKYLKRERIIEPSGDKWLFNSLNTHALKELGFTKVLTEDQLRDLLKFRQLNLFIHNTELSKLFFGPWYEISDPEKRHALFYSGTNNTYVGDPQFNQWHNSNDNNLGGHKLKESDKGFHTYRDNIRQMTFAEIKSASNEYENLKGSIKNAGKYLSMDGADAQGFMTAGGWKEYKLRTGEKWSTEDEAQHQYDLAKEIVARKDSRGEDISKELYNAAKEIVDKGNPQTYATGRPVKPVGVGMIANSDQGIPYADKTSLMRLSYIVAKDRNLEDLYWFMTDNDIQLSGPESFQKFGRPYLPKFKDTKGLPPVYKNANGKAKFALNDLEQGDKDQLIQEVPWSSFNKIVETAKSSEGKTLGTQALSMATVNIFDNGLPTDYYKDGDDYNKKSREWSDMDESSKRKTSELYRLQQDHLRSIDAIKTDGFNRVLKDFGVVDNDGNYTFTDADKLVNFLKREITRRDLADNVAAGLRTEFDAELDRTILEYPLESLPNFKDLNNILWSAIDKGIVRPKLHGGDNIMVTPELFERKGIRTYTDKDGKQSLGSSELQYYKRGELDEKTGKRRKTSVAQVWLPDFISEKLAKMGSKLSPTELFDYLNTKDGKELLDVIGFRIPTQGMNSIDALEIVPFDAGKGQYFLPADMGNSVVGPTELVTKVGLDFDVDKMGTYLTNFYVDDKGYPRKVKFIEDTQSDAGLEQLWEQRNKLNVADELDNILDYMGDTSNQFKQLDKDAKMAERQLQSLDKFISENRGKDPWVINSRQALENKYFETMRELLTHEDNFEQLVTPNSSDKSIAIEKHINGLLKYGEQSRGKDVNYSNLMKPLYLTKQRQIFRDATGNQIGIAAQNNTFHSQSQLAYQPVDVDIWLPHKKLKVGPDMVTVYSGRTDFNGDLISDGISEDINGAVDAVKDPWGIRLLKQKELLPVALTLRRLGVQPEALFTFLNQPVIQEYIRQENIGRNIRSINDKIEYRDEDKLLKLIRDSIQTTSSATLKRSENFKLDEMEDVLRAVGNGRELNDLIVSQKNLQWEVLNEFIKYRKISQESLEQQMALHSVNIPRVTGSSITTKENRVAVANEGKVLRSYERLQGKTIHSGNFKLLQNAKRAKGQITPLESNPALDNIVQTFTNPKLFISENDRNEAVSKGLNSLLDYISQVKGETTGNKLNSYLQKMLIDTDTSVAKQFADTKRKAIGDLKEVFNTVLKYMKPAVQFNPKAPKGIKQSSKPRTGVEADLLTDGLRTLRDNPDTHLLYNRLLISSILQSGTRSSANSILQYFDAPDVISILKPAMKSAIEGADLTAFDTLGSFYRNNWRDDSIVPLVKKSMDFNTGDRYNRYYTTDQWEPIPLAPEFREPKFMRVSIKNRIEYPFLKTQEIAINPKTGNPYTRSERDQMASAGDYSFNKTVLMQRVNTADGKPLQTVDSKGIKSYYYKQVNAWGNGNDMQEYYDSWKPSVNELNEKVQEVPDSYVQRMIGKGGEVESMESPKDIEVRDILEGSIKPVDKSVNNIMEAKLASGEIIKDNC